MRTAYLLPAMLLIALGCGTRELSIPANRAFPARFQSIRDRILKPRCAGCHGKIVQYSALVPDLIKPGKPESSELFTVIDSGEMPEYGNKLPEEEIAAIKAWIANGAKYDE